MYRKNTAGTITFAMIDAATGAGTAGLTVTGVRSIDGGAQASVTGAITSLGGGQYKFAAAAADLNGDNIGFLFTATGMIPVNVNVTTTAANLADGVRLGLTALPNAAAGASGGLPLAVDASGRVDVLKINGTSQTARDIGASVLLSSGTGTGQLDITSGVVKANLAQILGTALTETAGYIAAAFKQFFNVASPTGTMKAITAVDTVTNLTNAPTAGDFNATQKAYLTGGSLVSKVAVGTGAGQINVASGKVPSTIAAGDIATDAITAAAVKADAVTKIVGTPAGASVSADIAAVKSETAAIKGKTDSLTFTGAGRVDANVKAIDEQLTNGNNATLNLKKLNIINNAGDAIYAESTSSGSNGIKAVGEGGGAGIYARGGDSGDGLKAEAPVAGNGIYALGRDSLGSGILAATTGVNTAGITAQGTNGDGFAAVGGMNGFRAFGNSGKDIDADELDAIIDDVVGIKGNTWDSGSDTLEAIRDRIDDVMVSTGTPIGYSPTAATRTIGNDEGGTVTDLAAHDDSYMQTGENATTGLEVDITRDVSTVTEIPSVLRVVGFYSGVSTHRIIVSCYNYLTEAYEEKGVMINRSEAFEYSFPLSNANHDAATGEMKVKFKHEVTTYNATHFLRLDFVSWEKVEGNSQISSDLASIKAKTDQTQFDDGFILARNESGNKIAEDSTVAKEATLTSVQGVVGDIDSETGTIKNNLDTAIDMIDAYGAGIQANTNELPTNFQAVTDAVDATEAAVIAKLVEGKLVEEE